MMRSGSCNRSNGSVTGRSTTFQNGLFYGNVVRQLDVLRVSDVVEVVDCRVKYSWISLQYDPEM